MTALLSKHLIKFIFPISFFWILWSSPFSYAFSTKELNEKLKKCSNEIYFRGKEVQSITIHKEGFRWDEAQGFSFLAIRFIADYLAGFDYETVKTSIIYQDQSKLVSRNCLLTWMPAHDAGNISIEDCDSWETFWDSINCSTH